MSITVYSKNNCPACDRAKALLTSKNLTFEVKNIDSDLDAMDFVVEKRHRAMPVVYIDGVWVQDLNSLA